MSEDHNKLNVTRSTTTPARPKRKRDIHSTEPGPRSKRHYAPRTPERVVFAQVDANVMPAHANQKGVARKEYTVRKSSRTPSPPKRHLPMVSSAPVPDRRSGTDAEGSLWRHPRPHRTLPPESARSLRLLQSSVLPNPHLSPKIQMSMTSNLPLLILSWKKLLLSRTPAPSKLHPHQAPKVAKNVRNVRHSLCEEGFYFEDDDSYDKYPELRKEVERIFYMERGSSMRSESL